MKTLNFSPKKCCFSKVLIKWKGLALNGLLAFHQPVIDLSGEDITELLLELFGSLSFVEVCFLYQAVGKHPDLFESVDWKLFFKKQKFQLNSRNLELFEKLESMTREFLIWTQERQMSSGDLMPMNCLDDLDALKILTSHFQDMKLSRNEGKKILDLLVDLILMGKTTRELMPLSDNWYQQLMAKRYPNTLNADKSPQTKKTWPTYVQTKSFRQGDRVVHQLHLTYSNEDDLNSKLKHLSQMDGHV